MRVLTLFVLMLCVESGLGSPTSARTTSTDSHRVALREVFEKVAGELEFFDLLPFLVNSADLDFKPADAGAAPRYFLLLNQVLDPHLAVADIVPLRHHADAKVRTLALAALFQRNDPHLLPLIEELTNDANSTFPGCPKVSENWVQLSGAGPPPEKQSVGDVATEMVNFYVEAAGMLYARAAAPHHSAFQAYWEPRKNRKFCASWFVVQLKRAPGTWPITPQERANLSALRNRINALPAADRDWTLLYLHGKSEEFYWNDVFTSETELMEAAKRRGAAELLAFLNQHLPSDDPDLQLGSSAYSDLVRWILLRAPQLLQPVMADDLLKQQKDSRYLIAAAHLQPARAHDIIRAAWPRFADNYEGRDRVALMAALVELGSLDDYDFIATWYFAPARPNEFSSMGKEHEFFKRLPQRDAAPTTRRIIAHLINDKRFDETNFGAVLLAADLVNAWSGTPVVDTKKLSQAVAPSNEKQPEARATIAATIALLRQTSAKWGQ